MVLVESGLNSEQVSLVAIMIPICIENFMLILKRMVFNSEDGLIFEWSLMRDLLYIHVHVPYSYVLDSRYSRLYVT